MPIYYFIICIYKTIYFDLSNKKLFYSQTQTYLFVKKRYIFDPLLIFLGTDKHFDSLSTPSTRLSPYFTQNQIDWYKRL